jgi:hypothetical protein
MLSETDTNISQVLSLRTGRNANMADSSDSVLRNRPSERPDPLLSGKLKLLISLTFQNFAGVETKMFPSC